MTYDIGDHVIVRTVSGFIVSGRTEVWDDEIELSVVKKIMWSETEVYEYVLFVPCHVLIKSSTLMDSRNKLGIPQKFVGEHIVIVKPQYITRLGRQRADGNNCANCGDFCNYATEGFTCYSCRTNPYRQKMRPQK